MPDLRIDLDGLLALEQELRMVHAHFGNAEEFSDAVADLVGHPQLHDVVHDFAGKWNIRREELMQEIQRVADTAEAIRETFQELDREMADHIGEFGHAVGAALEPRGGLRA